MEALELPVILELEEVPPVDFSELESGRAALQFRHEASRPGATDAAESA